MLGTRLSSLPVGMPELSGIARMTGDPFGFLLQFRIRKLVSAGGRNLHENAVVACLLQAD
jgi:hypothetical protein